MQMVLTASYYKLAITLCMQRKEASWRLDEDATADTADDSALMLGSTPLQALCYISLKDRCQLQMHEIIKSIQMSAQTGH